jgi:hypothetical protein
MPLWIDVRAHGKGMRGEILRLFTHARCRVKTIRMRMAAGLVASSDAHVEYVSTDGHAARVEHLQPYTEIKSLLFSFRCL